MRSGVATAVWKTCVVGFVALAAGCGSANSSSDSGGGSTQAGGADAGQPGAPQSAAGQSDASGGLAGALAGPHAQGGDASRWRRNFQWRSWRKGKRFATHRGSDFRRGRRRSRDRHGFIGRHLHRQERHCRG